MRLGTSAGILAKTSTPRFAEALAKLGAHPGDPVARISTGGNTGAAQFWKSDPATQARSCKLFAEQASSPCYRAFVGRCHSARMASSWEKPLLDLPHLTERLVRAGPKSRISPSCRTPAAEIVRLSAGIVLHNCPHLQLGRTLLLVLPITSRGCSTACALIRSLWLF
jgi:hypothetical protein